MLGGDGALGASRSGFLWTARVPWIRSRSTVPQTRVIFEIRDAQTGAPVEGARIRLHREDDPQGPEFSLASDAAGQIVVEQLPHARFAYRVDHTRYTPLTKQALELVSGTEEERVPLRLQQTGIVEVLLLDEAGAPLMVLNGLPLSLKAGPEQRAMLPHRHDWGPGESSLRGRVERWMHVPAGPATVRLGDMLSAEHAHFARYGPARERSFHVLPGTTHRMEFSGSARATACADPRPSRRRARIPGGSSGPRWRGAPRHGAAVVHACSAPRAPWPGR